MRYFDPYEEPFFNRVTLEHVEGKGLGYSTGYTSLDLFFAQPLRCGSLSPFIDLRGHLFNDGKTAANAGCGLRWLPECSDVIWGVNGYYDHLKTPHRTYQQVSLGLEAMGKYWAIRINGYLPIGRTKRPLYEFNYENLDPLSFLLKGKEQFAMKGVDSEFGYYFNHIPFVYLYAGLGPYYYWGRSSATKNVWKPKNEYALGGRARIQAYFLRYLSLEGIATYDAQFKWTGQAVIALNIHLGHLLKSFVGKSDCKKDPRFYQPVLRNEIIAIDTIHRFSHDPEVLNPEHNP